MLRFAFVTWSFGFFIATSVCASSIQVTPVSFDFGNVAVGDTSLPQEVIFTNLGDVPVSPNFAGGAVPGKNFPGSQNCAGVTLAPGASCQFTYRFTPQALGPVSGSTSATVDSETYSFNFKGNGIRPFWRRRLHSTSEMCPWDLSLLRRL